MNKILIKIKQAIPLISVLSSRYDGLTVKRKIIFISVMIVISIAVLFRIVYAPLNDWSDMQVSDYRRQVKTLTWMQQNIDEARDAEERKVSSVGRRELSSVVSRLANREGVVITRIQPDKKGIGVWLDDAAYQKTLAWLVSLEDSHIVIHKVKFDRQKNVGRIKGYIHLSES